MFIVDSWGKESDEQIIVRPLYLGHCKYHGVKHLLCKMYLPLIGCAHKHGHELPKDGATVFFGDVAGSQHWRKRDPGTVRRGDFGPTWPTFPSHCLIWRHICQMGPVQNSSDYSGDFLT